MYEVDDDDTPNTHQWYTEEDPGALDDDFFREDEPTDGEDEEEDGLTADHNEDDYDDSMDGDFDSGMASAGLGTDESYGYFGGDEDY
jgi:hypothetical protein